MDIDRDSLAAALVGTGGAWLLGAALLQGRSGRWNGAQLRGLCFAGSGFLLSAVAAHWLRDTGRPGIALSLVGTLLAMRGMYLLIRERAAEKSARNAQRPRTPE